MHKQLWIILLTIFIANLLFRIYSYRSDYLTSYNPAFWQERFDHSQWSTTKGCTNLDPHVNPYTCVWDDHWYAQHKNDPNAQYLKKQSIGDDALYTYAGWEYIHGHDPSTLNAEIPPFGKYLIGISEIVFLNQNIFSLITGLTALGAFYFFNCQIFRNKLFAFIPVLLFSFEPLFYEQLKSPMLDNLYLTLGMLTLTFFLKKKYGYSMLFLGLMAATKSALSTVPLVIGVLLVYLLVIHQPKEIKRYLFRLPIAIVIFLITYTQYFLLGHSLRQFLGVQKWIYTFYATGAKGSFITPWEMLLIGRWHTWWGTNAVVSEWHAGWLAMLLIGVMISIWFVRRKFTNPVIICAIWVFAYLAFLSLIPTWPRYLLLVLPFLYTMTIWFIVTVSKHHEIS